MIFFPNCKINIGLNIIAQRLDGYHHLESIFYPVPLCDVMEIETSKNHFTYTQTGLDTGCEQEKNLAVKAYRLMQELYFVPEIQIHLHKIIPLGAGLGGGSADAAFMISALNNYFNLNLPTEQLYTLCKKIGSDCSFFILNKPAFVTGTGDIVKPFNVALKGYHLILIKPDIHVSTAEAYSLITPHAPEYNLQEIIQEPVNNWRNKIQNDFEVPLFKKHPSLQRIKDKLYDQGALYASMTGSGSAVYGIFEKQKSLHSFFQPYFYWQGLL